MKLATLVSTLVQLDDMEVKQPDVDKEPYAPIFISKGHDALQTVLHVGTSEDGEITLAYGFHENGTSDYSITEFFHQDEDDVEAFLKKLLAMYSDDGVAAQDIEL